METLNYLLKFCICSLFIFMTGFIVWWYILEWMKRKIAREDEYDKLYELIKSNINNWPVTPVNRYRLHSKILELKHLKYKNPEKTSVLTNNFFWKYRSLNSLYLCRDI